MNLTTLHGKSVYGYYAARIKESQCDRYRGAPYAAWMAAWRENRCFTPAELDGLCNHLEHERAAGRAHAATLVFSGIWTAAQAPECRARLESRLGAVIDQTEISTLFARRPKGIDPSAVLRFGGRCVNDVRTK